MFKVLVVDDEEFVRDGLINHVAWNELGISAVEQADDGVTALKIASVFMPHIIVSDIRMHHMNGIDLAVHLRKFLPGCKIIFMSAYSDKEYYKSAIHLKAVSYVEKPIDLEEMTTAISQAVVLCKEDEEVRRTRDEMKNMIKENLDHLRNNIVLDLVSGKRDIGHLVDALKQGGCELPAKGAYLTAILRLKHDEAGKTDIEGIFQLIDAALSELGLFQISGYKTHEQIIIVIGRKTSKEKAFSQKEQRQIAEKISISLINYFSFFIAVGEPAGNLANIDSSYRTAVLALQDLFYKGFNNYSVYEQPHTNAYKFDENIVGNIDLLLDGEKKEELLELVRALTKDIRSSKNTIVNSVKDIYFKIILRVHNMAKKRGVELSSEGEQNFIWEILSKYDTLDQVEEYLINNIGYFFDTLEKSPGGNKTVSTIIKLINQGYSDPNLSLKSLSRSMFLSDTYLCVLFKKETGSTINNYIQDIRIEKAKEFLKDNSVKILDIARKVGFDDRNYFTKLFKKYTNMTPSEYRERYLV